MSQLRYRDESLEREEETLFASFEERLEEETTEREEQVLGRTARREAALVEMQRHLPLGIAQGALAAWVMTELGRISNPLLQIEGKAGWLLWAVLGAISGLAAATGRRNTAWSAAGMGAGVLLSPPLLEWLCRITDRPLMQNPAETSLVLVAALLIGAFTWLRRWSVWRAAWVGAVGFWLICYLYNTIRMPGVPSRGLLDAAWVSAEHGFLVGAALSLLRSASQTLLDWRTRWIDQLTERTLEWLRRTKDA